ncbi:hypothetical protein H4Q26_007144 [Puccinia striiformis f. sp. tritici PST-130]|nr:hypothetical protein H4Q26_007144 [Puccinia striiformis f. sp. tritici PST-130]
MAQAQADREEYTRRLACQDANATVCQQESTVRGSYDWYNDQGCSLQLILNFERTTVNDKDLAEGITFDLLDVVESDIYKLHLLEEAPFGNYVAPTAWKKAQAANRKAPTPHLPARRQTSRPAGVAGISDKEMWPEYDHMSEAALDAIDTQAAICETLALDKICATYNKAILAEFGDLSFPPMW